MRRFIVFSDLHLHLWNYGATTVNRRNSRLLDQVQVLGAILMHALQNDIKEIVFTGDFFHTHSSIRSEVLWAAHTFLSSLKRENIKVTFLIGNHDYTDREGDIHSIDFLKEFGTVVEQPGLYNDFFWAMSYTEDQCKLVEFLEKAPVNSVVLMHQGLSNIPVNSKGFTINEILHPTMVPDHIAGAFVGHYHSRFQVHNKKIWSPGSPMQLTWTDTGEDRGLLDVTWHPDKPIEVIPVTLESPKFITVMEPIEAVEGNFVRIMTNNLDIKDQIIKMGARSCEVIIREQTEPTKFHSNNSSNFDSLPSIVGAYMDHRNVEAPTRKIGEQIMEGTYCVK